MEGSEKLHFKKEGMVNNQCLLDFITSKSLVTWGSICSIQCIGSWGRTQLQCDDKWGCVRNVHVKTSYLGDT